MSLRSVLVLTYHFPPSAASGSFRMLGFARHLPKFGWRAVVVAPPTIPWEPVDHELLSKVPPETAVYPVPYVKSRVVRRVAPIAGWLPRALGACRVAIREEAPEALLTSGPPHQVHWLGLWLKRRYGLRWAADFRDPWYPEGRTERGRDFASWQVRVQEAAVFRAADTVIANAPGACKLLRAAYPEHRTKFVTLPNGYDRELFGAEVPPIRPPGGPVRVVHAGAIYVNRDPRPFLDAVKTLSTVGRVPLEVAFFGPPPETDLDLGAEVTRRGLGDRVAVNGQVPYARSLQEMVTSDILLLMDSPGRAVGVPAKLYEYIGAGKAVLALGERGGDLEWVLSQSGVPHRIAPPGDAGAIATALAGLVDEVKSAFGPSLRPHAHRFSRETIAGHLAALLDRCTTKQVGQGASVGPGAEAGAGGSPMAVMEC